jgi:hypothetical protein
MDELSHGPHVGWKLKFRFTAVCGDVEGMAEQLAAVLDIARVLPSVFYGGVATAEEAWCAFDLRHSLIKGLDNVLFCDGSGDGSGVPSWFQVV